MKNKKKNLEDKILIILKKHFKNISKKKISLNFEKIDNFDSLKMINLYLELEHIFKIKFNLKEFEKIKKPSDLINIVKIKVK